MMGQWNNGMVAYTSVAVLRWSRRISRARAARTCPSSRHCELGRSTESCAGCTQSSPTTGMSSVTHSTSTSRASASPLRARPATLPQAPCSPRDDAGWTVWRRRVECASGTWRGSGHGDGIKVRAKDGDGVGVNGVAAPSGKVLNSSLLSRNSSTRVWHTGLTRINPENGAGTEYAASTLFSTTSQYTIMREVTACTGT